MNKKLIIFLLALMMLTLIGVSVFRFVTPEVKQTQTGDVPKKENKAAVLRIMPLGDSLTMGYHMPNSYRLGLWQDFDARGVSIDFVGSQSDGAGEMPDKNHEGHNGFTTGEILSNVNAWVSQNPPDVVTLMIGTNDILQGVKPEESCKNISLIIDEIYKIDPEIHVFVASIPKLGANYSQLSDEVNELNDLIRKMAEGRSNIGEKIYFVDINKVIEEKDLYNDSIHISNDDGYKKIADAWYTSIASVLKLSSTVVKSGERYYVSNKGNDANDGKTPQTPWKTLDKVNHAEIRPGDTVYFECGSIWRESLIPASGNEFGNFVTYKSYGTGVKPTLLGSVSKNADNCWISAGNDIWMLSDNTGRLPAADTSGSGGFVDIGNMIFDEGSSVGRRVFTESDMQKQGDFWCSEKDGTLKLYSKSNPAQIYKSIECAQSRDIIQQGSHAYIIYEGLALRYGGAHGIGGGNTHHIAVKNCEISYIGGGRIKKSSPAETRYGNGINFSGNAHDNFVGNCKIYEVFDSAVCNQSEGIITAQYRITYRGNLIWNCENSIEIWSGTEGSSLSDISVDDNTCTNAGGGWGHTQHAIPRGAHLYLPQSSANAAQISITGNTFKNTTDYIWVLSKAWKGMNNIRFEYNKISVSAKSPAILWGDQQIGKTELQAFEEESGIKLVKNNTIEYTDFTQ